MSGRIILGAIAALGVLVSLTGCSVPQTGMTGVRVADGHVLVEIRMCNEATADGIDILPLDGQLFFLPHPYWDFDGEVSTQIDLGSVDDVTALVGTSEQSLDISTDSGLVSSPNIDAATLVSLTADKVLVSEDRGPGSRLIGANLFEQLASEYCAARVY